VERRLADLFAIPAGELLADMLDHEFRLGLRCPGRFGGATDTSGSEPMAQPVGRSSRHMSPDNSFLLKTESSE